jgi:predicted anti-sigma-YlaC factor YlaD
MNDKSDCSVFKDLYPSYLNEELEDETIDWIKDHLAECKNCRQWTEKYKGETELDEEFKEEIDPMQDNEIKVIKRARIFLITGVTIVIALALWTSLWIVS